MKKNRGNIVMVLVLCLSFFSGCGEKEVGKQQFHIQFFDIFDTVSEVTGYEEKQEIFEKNVNFIRNRLEYYAKRFDIYQDYEGLTNIKDINEVAGKEAVKVDEEIIQLLRLGQKLYSESDGALNIAMGGVLNIWHRHRKEAAKKGEGTFPDMWELVRAKEHSDIEQIVINDRIQTVKLTDSEMSLDVGAIAKGFAIEKVAREMKDRGMESYLLNVGGNIRALGAKPDGEPWLVGIQNPDTSSEKVWLDTVSLTEETLSTSGGYFRYYKVGDETFHHIINRETLMPSDYFLSVSIIGKAESGEIDGYSTIAFIMPFEKSKQFVEANPKIEAIWVLKDGTIEYSSGMDQYLTK